MRGLYDELRETILALHVGQVTAFFAQEKLDEAKARVAVLRRRNQLAYADEINEIETAVEELQAEVNARAPAVRIFHRPGRTVVITTPGVPDARGRLADIQVVRIGQVDFIEMDNRLRVRDWWELKIDGRSLSPPVEGPKRWIMKNAAGAEALDVFGKPPAHMLLTGLAKRRDAHKRRRDRRREADSRRRMPKARRAFKRAIERQQRGLVVFAGIVGYIPGEGRHVNVGDVRLEEVDPNRVAPPAWPGRG